MRVIFRLCVVYFTLFALATHVVSAVLILPGFSLPQFGRVWPMRDITLWCAEHVFGVAEPLIYAGNSGDTLFHWVQAFWTLSLAVVAAGLWSWLDRGRGDYEALHRWFRLFLRFALAAEMFYYGLAKVVPTQFLPPALVTLVQPLGDLSRSDLLWVLIGASTPYQVFTGFAEVLAGILLLTPRTTLLGALVCLVDMIQVFALNMSYDFGLKLISLHLILMSLFLIAPDLPRLVRLLVSDGPVPPPAAAPLFRTAAASRIALIAQVAFGIYLIGMFTNVSLGFWYAEGGAGAPKSPLYGIWDVMQLTIDGQESDPSLTDYDRQWRRVIFDSPRRIIFQRIDDSFATYGVSIDTAAGAMSLTKGSSRTWQSGFSFERVMPDRLILDGEMDGYRIRADLQLVARDTFRLLNSTFRWVRPPDPFAG